jgi:hypothetical protein
MRIDFDFLLPLATLLEALPGVAPRNAVALLEQAHVLALEQKLPIVRLAGKEFAIERFHELFIENGAFGDTRVSPAGAELLLELYECDVLPLKAGASRDAPTFFITGYIAAAPDLVNATAKWQEAQARRSARLASKTTAPGANYRV